MNKTSLNRRAALAGFGAVGVSFASSGGASATSHARKVNSYNWDTYIGETTLGDFSAATGIDVQYDLFADNDELFAELENGNLGYDLIVPTNDYVERMIVVDMLMPLDHARIPNMANIERNFLNLAFDPGRVFSLPYMWGSVGVGYRKSAVSRTPDSWAYLLTSDEYA